MQQCAGIHYAWLPTHASFSGRDLLAVTHQRKVMTIRQRITLLVILTFIAISAIGGYAVLQSRSSAIEVKSVTEGVVPSVLASSDLVGQLKDVQLAAMVMVAESDAALVAQENEKLAAKKITLEKALE